MSRTTSRTRPASSRSRDRGVVRALVHRVLTTSVLTAVVAGGAVTLDAATAPDRATVSGAGFFAAGSDTLVPASASRCGDLLVIAVDGNAQGGKGKPGKVTRRVVNDLKKRGAAEGRSVAVKSIPVTTRRAGVLAPQKKRASAKAITRKGIRTWRAPVAGAVTRTRGVLADQVSNCPQQQVVLVGYAQGAAVVHRVLQRAGNRQRALIQGAVTVSDPWRVKKSVTGQPLGAPPATRGSQGMLSRFANNVGDVPATTPGFRVLTVCTKGDLVCNPNQAKVSTSVIRHRYATKAARSALDSASWALWQRVKLAPVPVARRLELGAGVPFAEQLRVNGGSTSGAPAVWTATSLPAGVTLSRTGLLQGTLEHAGTYEVAYTVAGRAPVSIPRSGSATLLIHGDRGGIAAGGQSSCEVRPGGTLWCWGANEYGQLGDGSTTDRQAPAQLAGKNWVNVSTSGATTCGVRRNGTLWCWGLNNFGQLGRSDTARRNKPRKVDAATNWSNVSVSTHHACGLKTDGSAWCWGYNGNGQAGNGKTARRTNGPVKVAGTAKYEELTTGGWHTCGRNRKDVLRCWGLNTFGQVGDGTKQRRVKPRKVTGNQTYTAVSADWSRTCAVTSSGGMQCWGDNVNGELGTGNRKNSTTPATVKGNQRWTSVSTGLSHTCGADGTGRVWCWGDNRYGQLGSGGGNSARSTTPVNTGVTSPGGAVSTGWMHTCAAGGTCWGAGDKGQWGTGSFVPVTMTSKRAPSWPRGNTLTTKQVNNWGAPRIAKSVVQGRPKVNARAKGDTAVSFGVMTFNVLGTQHTAPGGGRPDWAPGRARAEWARTIVENKNVSLVGLSEPQPDQIDSINQTLGGNWTIYPGNTMGYAPAPQSVMWRDADWEYVWGNTASMPFMRGQRPQPVVRLRHKQSQREVYLINAHLSPGNMQADRDKGIAIIVALVKALEGDGLPVLVTGDLNEHAVAFRRIACGAGMVAAVGGVSQQNTCTLPKHMRVDWIFGKGGTFSRTVVDTVARVRRTTDHAVVSSTFTVR